MEVELNCAGGGGSIYSKVLLFILTFSLNRQQTTEESKQCWLVMSFRSWTLAQLL